MSINPNVLQLLFILSAAVALSTGRQTPGINLVRTNSYKQSQVCADPIWSFNPNDVLFSPSDVRYPLGMERPPPNQPLTVMANQVSREEIFNLCCCVLPPWHLKAYWAVSTWVLWPKVGQEKNTKESWTQVKYCDKGLIKYDDFNKHHFGCGKDVLQRITEDFIMFWGIRVFLKHQIFISRPV